MTSTTPTLAEVVERALADSGLSALAVEKRTGISRMTLRRKLADDSRFTVGELDKIAQTIGVPLSTLISLTERAA